MPLKMMFWNFVYHNSYEYCLKCRKSQTKLNIVKKKEENWMKSAVCLLNWNLESVYAPPLLSAKSNYVRYILLTNEQFNTQLYQIVSN